MGFIWHLCIANMKQRGIRTGLTILGVVIGVISVVSMLALGLGVKQELLSDAMMDGSVTDIRVYGASEGKRRDRMLTDRRIADMERIPHIERVTPMLTASVRIGYDRYAGFNEITGVPRDYLESLTPMYGYSPEVNGTRLELLAGAGALNLFYHESTGTTFVEAKAPTKEEQEELDREMERLERELESGNWFDRASETSGRESEEQPDGTSGESALESSAVERQSSGFGGNETDITILTDSKTGRTYRLDRRWNDMSGEYVELQTGSGENETVLRARVAGMLSEYDYNIYCDMDTLKKQLKANAVNGVAEGQPTDENGNAIPEWVYSSAIVKVDAVEHVDTVTKRLADMGYQAESNKEFVDEVQREIRIIRILLGAIGAIALIVAVIGIGNTMTTSVYDRTYEIGILKVLGCDPDELMGLFLLESGILGGIGGLLGLLCSYGIARFGINRFGVKLLQMPRGTELAVIPGWLAVAAVVMAVLLGIIAGYFPAKWAMKMRPIDAVRRNT